MSLVPRGRHFEEFAVGEKFTTAARTVTESAVDRFAGLSGDFNPLHADEESARRGSARSRSTEAWPAAPTEWMLPRWARLPARAPDAGRGPRGALER